jgi:hypothetical protein
MGRIVTTEYLLLFSILIIIFVVKHNSLFRKTMDNISESNRYMSGTYIWLNLIPIFNIFWIIIYNYALNKSINAEIREKKLNFRFLGITGILYPAVTYAMLLAFIIIAISGVNNFDKSISELIFITLLFSGMAVVWGWLFYIAEIASFNKMNTKGEVKKIVSTVLYIIITVSFILLMASYYIYSK